MFKFNHEDLSMNLLSTVSVALETNNNAGSEGTIQLILNNMSNSVGSQKNCILQNLGEMVEDSENKLRAQITNVYKNRMIGFLQAPMKN